MTVDEAKSVLHEHGWHQGMSTAGHPERDALKDALNTLKREGVDPTSAEVVLKAGSRSGKTVRKPPADES